MGCTDSFYDQISNCNTAVRVNALLIPATPYIWVITDKFGKEYSGVSITNANGFFDIPISELPDGFFMPFSGEFKLEIFEETNACKAIDFKIAKYFDSIVFSVADGSRVKDNLGCDFACETTGGGPGNSAIFPFTGIATLNITWTELLKSIYGGTPTVQVYLMVSPGVYQLTNVSVTMIGGPYDLSEIDIDFGGMAEGYVLVS